MHTYAFPTIFFRYPDGGQVVMAMPGIPRRGDTVSARWGTNAQPTLYRVTDVVWDMNEVRVLVHLAAADGGEPSAG